MITVTLTNKPDFQYLINEVQRPGNIVRGFATYRRSQFNQGIAKGKDPYGQTYAPLTRAYLERKERKYGSKAILSASGAMVASYTQTVTPDGFTESVDTPANFHQSGTRKMAQRMLLPGRGLPEGDQDKLLQLVFDQLKLR